jgi:ABC-type protease/lipase transport system fused ATPase/permease subunit
MVRYFYAWTPLVILGTVVLLSMPWLGLIALMIVSLVALVMLAALAGAIVFVPYKLSRAIGRRRHEDRGATQQTAAVLSPAAALSPAKRQNA